eukprot:gene31201-35216_t
MSRGVAHNIADLFEHAVDAAPGKPALKVGDRTVTYAELERDANRLAHYLQAQGVQPGDHVAVYAKNSVEHVVAVLAVVKIRAVNINVNYRYVEGELNYLFDNADVVALIHERSYAPLVAACAPKHEKLKTFVVLPDILEPDSQADVSSYGGVLLADAVADQGDERDFGPRSNDDLHIIYTGGTTGKPKGVIGTSAAMATMTQVQLAEWEWPENPRFLMCTPLSHAGAAFFVPTVIKGGSLYVLSRFDPAEVLRTIEEQRITATMLVPSMLYALMDHPDSHTRDLSSLETVYYGASAINPVRLKEAIDRFGPNGSAWVVALGSRVAGQVQTGYVYTYAFVMLIGLTAAVTWAITR